MVDTNYIPHTPDKQALFMQKQIFMYSIFCHTLLTNIRLKLVRVYEESSDVQSIFWEFIVHYTTSVKADLDQAQLMEYIATLRLGKSGHRKGWYYSLTLHFQDQLCKLDDLQDSLAACFSIESHSFAAECHQAHP